MHTLIIGDLHHDLPWVGRVLAAEDELLRRGDPVEVVFLGDYFDAHRPECSASKVCAFLTGLDDYLYGQYHGRIRAHFLVGNHDVQYALLAGERHAPRDADAVRLHTSGYSKSRAGDIRRRLPAAWWDRCSLALFRHGHLITHAGVLPHLWPFIPEGARVETLTAPPKGVWPLGRWPSAPDETAVDRAALERFMDETTRLWQDRHAAWTHPAFAYSRALRRTGGRPDDTGVRAEMPPAGLLWCDFREEFADVLPYPQIVGHTGVRGEARRKGRSWCLDGHQTTYGVLSESGLVVKSA